MLDYFYSFFKRNRDIEALFDKDINELVVAWQSLKTDATIYELRTQRKFGDIHRQKTVLWLLSEAANGHPELFMEMWQRFHQELTVDDFLAVIENGPDAGKSALLQLAEAAANGYPAPLLAVWAQFGHEIAQIARFDPQNQSIYPLLCWAAANGHINLYNLRITTFTDFDQLVSVYSDGPEKGVNLLWLLAFAAFRCWENLKDKNQGNIRNLIRVIIEISYRTKRTQPFSPFMEVGRTAGHWGGMTTYWFIAYLIEQGALDKIEDKCVDLFDGIKIANLRAVAKSGIHRGKSVLWLLASAGVKGNLALIKQMWYLFGQDMTVDDLRVCAEDGAERGETVLEQFAKLAGLGFDEPFLTLWKQNKTYLTADDCPSTLLLSIIQAAKNGKPAAMKAVVARFPHLFSDQERRILDPNFGTAVNAIAQVAKPKPVVSQPEAPTDANRLQDDHPLSVAIDALFVGNIEPFMAYWAQNEQTLTLKDFHATVKNKTNKWASGDVSVLMVLAWAAKQGHGKPFEVVWEKFKHKITPEELRLEGNMYNTGRLTLLWFLAYFARKGNLQPLKDMLSTWGTHLRLSDYEVAPRHEDHQDISTLVIVAILAKSDRFFRQMLKAILQQSRGFIHRLFNDKLRYLEKDLPEPETRIETELYAIQDKDLIQLYDARLRFSEEVNGLYSLENYFLQCLARAHFAKSRGYPYGLLDLADYCHFRGDYRRESETLARIEKDSPAAESLTKEHYPALFDACIQAIASGDSKISRVELSQIAESAAGKSQHSSINDQYAVLADYYGQHNQFEQEMQALSKIPINHPRLVQLQQSRYHVIARHFAQQGNMELAFKAAALSKHPDAQQLMQSLVNQQVGAVDVMPAQLMPAPVAKAIVATPVFDNTTFRRLAAQALRNKPKAFMDFWATQGKYVTVEALRELSSDGPHPTLTGWVLLALLKDQGLSNAFDGVAQQLLGDIDLQDWFRAPKAGAYAGQSVMVILAYAAKKNIRLQKQLESIFKSAPCHGAIAKEDSGSVYSLFQENCPGLAKLVTARVEFAELLSRLAPNHTIKDIYRLAHRARVAHDYGYTGVVADALALLQNNRITLDEFGVIEKVLMPSENALISNQILSQQQFSKYREVAVTASDPQQRQVAIMAACRAALRNRNRQRVDTLNKAASLWMGRAFSIPAPLLPYIPPDMPIAGFFRVLEALKKRLDKPVLQEDTLLGLETDYAGLSLQDTANPVLRFSAATGDDDEDADVDDKAPGYVARKRR